MIILALTLNSMVAFLTRILIRVFEKFLSLSAKADDFETLPEPSKYVMILGNLDSEQDYKEAPESHPFL